MLRAIYRVDERFIHGQVLEGWINYYQLKDIIIVNDDIAENSLTANIYRSILSSDISLSIYGLKDFLNGYKTLSLEKKSFLLLVGNMADLEALSETFFDKLYINIGCLVTNSEDKVALSDCVYVSHDDIEIIDKLSKNHIININKLPWERPVPLERFLSL